MLYDYLIDVFNSGDFIFLEDIHYKGTPEAIRQQMKALTDQGKIRRFTNGVYYIPEKKWGIELSPSINDYIQKKYVIDRNGNTIGYVGGITAVNQARLTTQMSVDKMVVFTNKATTAMKTIKVKDYTIILKRPLLEITNENYRVLRFLSMLLDSEVYSELRGEEYKAAIRTLVKKEQLDGEKLMKIAAVYPEKIYMSLYKGGVLQYVG
ncbi:MAG: hypothetical protein KBT01_01950 [Clostridiales bacterium]|nr:hypothetical protein [Candidatus Blautia equi]